MGATGAVGQEIIRLWLRQGGNPTQLVPLASARSAGTLLTVAGQSWNVREAQPDVFAEVQLAIFSAGAKTSKALVPEAVRRGCIVIDNSSAFRMDPQVPLVIPEINREALAHHNGIIANPNCSTAIALMSLYPLHRAFGLKRFFAATYQAVSGSGAAAIRALEEQVRAWAEQVPIETTTYPHPIAFNLFPHVDEFLDNGYTKEEMKLLHEARKILDLPALQISVTCVRVPVFRAHSIAIHAAFERSVDFTRAQQALDAFEGVELCDEPLHNRYPTPRTYTEKYVCGVGRLRRDTAFKNGLALWVVGDQLWKGAALNALQIAACLPKETPS